MDLAFLLAVAADEGSTPTSADLTAAVAAVLAAVAAFGGWLTTWIRGAQLRKDSSRDLAIKEGFSQFNTAVNYLYSGRPELALVGVGILKRIRVAEWVDDAMRQQAVDCLRNYTQYRSREAG